MDWSPETGLVLHTTMLRGARLSAHGSMTGLDALTRRSTTGRPRAASGAVMAG